MYVKENRKQRINYMKPQILIVIPLRGGSKGIPKKNLRLLNGKPLLTYVLNNAFFVASQEQWETKVVVDTDDSEIEEISCMYGAKVIRRPKELADDNITLDPVIYHAVKELENKNDEKYDIVITMQATSPTLKSGTIKKAIEVFLENDSYETMISGVNKPHLSWTVVDGATIPNYEKRLNRQKLPVHLEETGGFLITKRECITKNQRIGKTVTVFEVPEKEAIDIDSELDWKICESVLNSKRIILRADGEECLGMGHIYRVLSIAYHLVGHDVLFVTNQTYRMGAERLKESFFAVKYITDNNEIFEIIDEFKPDIVVNDILNTDKEYMIRMKRQVSRVVNFEDRGEGASYADAVINALYEQNDNLNTYSGFKYFFIRDEFLTVKPKEFSETVKNIVVLFGGSDPSNMTQIIYDIWKEIADDYPNIDLHIITGFGYKYKNEIKSDGKYNIYIHNDVKRVSKYLAEADMAITSQGRTIFEIACMGVPAIVLAENTRELTHVFAGFENGFINLGLGREQESETIKSTIEWLIRTSNVRRQMRDLLLDKDFQGGQKRVLSLILGENE